jgi:hypothetical protein
VVAVMATVAKGYDLDYAWRAVGEAYRGAGLLSRGRRDGGAAGHLVGSWRRTAWLHRRPAGGTGAIQPAVRAAEGAGRAEARPGPGERREGC